MTTFGLSPYSLAITSGNAKLQEEKKAVEGFKRDIGEGGSTYNEMRDTVNSARETERARRDAIRGEMKSIRDRLTGAAKKDQGGYASMANAQADALAARNNSVVDPNDVKRTVYNGIEVNPGVAARNRAMGEGERADLASKGWEVSPEGVIRRQKKSYDAGFIGGSETEAARALIEKAPQAYGVTPGMSQDQVEAIIKQNADRIYNSRKRYGVQDAGAPVPRTRKQLIASRTDLTPNQKADFLGKAYARQAGIRGEYPQDVVDAINTFRGSVTGSPQGSGDAGGGRAMVSRPLVRPGAEELGGGARNAVAYMHYKTDPQGNFLRDEGGDLIPAEGSGVGSRPVYEGDDSGVLAMRAGSPSPGPQVFMGQSPGQPAEQSPLGYGQQAGNERMRRMQRYQDRNARYAANRQAQAQAQQQQMAMQQQAALARAAMMGNPVAGQVLANQARAQAMNQQAMMRNNSVMQQIASNERIAGQRNASEAARLAAEQKYRSDLLSQQGDISEKRLALEEANAKAQRELDAANIAAQQARSASEKSVADARVREIELRIAKIRRASGLSDGKFPVRSLQEEMQIQAQADPTATPEDLRMRSSISQGSQELTELAEAGDPTARALFSVPGTQEAGSMEPEARLIEYADRIAGASGGHDALSSLNGEGLASALKSQGLDVPQLKRATDRLLAEVGENGYTQKQAGMPDLADLWRSGIVRRDTYDLFQSINMGRRALGLPEVLPSGNTTGRDYRSIQFRDSIPEGAARTF